MSPYMKPCWSCGAIDRPCFGDCECAKCIDPYDYAEWRRDNPGAYARWMAKNVEDDYEAQRWWDKSEELMQ